MTRNPYLVKTGLFTAMFAVTAEAYCRQPDAAAFQISTLTAQVAAMPDDFRTHFFNTPLSSRVMLDNRVLADAMITLTPDGRASIIHFTDTAESEYSESDRQHWLSALTQPVPLGQCGTCPPGLIALDFNLSDARLILISDSASAKHTSNTYMLPKKADYGLMLNNQLNISGAHKDHSALSWHGGLEAAVNAWSVSSQFQLDHYSSDETPLRHAITDLYAQREFQHASVLRVGLFTPQNSGLIRQPYLPGGGINSLVGVMAGSSDTLLRSTGFPSLYPVYVTANREGVAEIWRDDRLIGTQPVSPGLQLVDTTGLPQGIYEVEIRVIEDGRESSRTLETINKPASWRNPAQRLRYNIFAGQQQTLLNSDADWREAHAAAGIGLNYLLHPRASAGVILQKKGPTAQSGVSIDWHVSDAFNLYNALWYSDEGAQGADIQGVWSHKAGTVALNHSQSWLTGRERSTHRQQPYKSNSSVTSTWRLTSQHHLSGRVAWNSSDAFPGMDVGFTSRTTLGGTAINWQLSAFDRPGYLYGGVRNRGASLNLSFPLGEQHRRASVSIGSRTDSSGQRDLYAATSLHQQWAEGNLLTSSSATVTADRHGVGLSSWNRFATAQAEGDFWLQTSSLDNRVSGGLSSHSTLALSGRQAVLAQHPMHHQGGGMIVNLHSDDADARLLAFHDGGQTTLTPGRNFIPLNAWQPGTVQLDFPGSEAVALKVQPEFLDYHHIRGGVSVHDVRVMKTVTVAGRLVDQQRNPLGGATVVNHAGQTMTDATGLFTLELHENNPVMTITHHSGRSCEITLSPKHQRKSDIVFAGDLTCESAYTAQNKSTHSPVSG